MKNRQFRTGAARRGSALVASMIVVMVLSFMGAAMIQVLSARTKRQMGAVDTVRALYIAEAGLSEAYFAVAQGKTGSVGSEANPAAFANGFYWVEASETSEGQVALVSHGMCGTGRFSLATCLQRQVNAIGALGVFGDEQLSIGSGVSIDGYDSRDGSYQAQIQQGLQQIPAIGGAQVGSNGEIHIGEAQGASWNLGSSGESPAGGTATHIFGDARPGPASTVVMDPWAEVSGSTNPAFNSVSLPAIDVPKVEPTTGETLIGALSQGSLNTVSGRAAYDHLHVTGGGQLTVMGPATLVLGRLEVDAEASVVLDSSSGPISIYVTEQLWMAEGSTLDSKQEDAAQAALLVSAVEGVDHDQDGQVDPAVHLRAAGKFCGMVYAPEADMVLPAGLFLMGSIASKTLELEAEGQVVFDSSLANEGQGIDLVPRLISWHVVDLPNSPYTTVRVDPQKLLSEHGVVPRTSSDAHRERSLVVDYVDWSGTPQAFTGVPASLDWSTVAEVLSVAWFDAHGNPVDPFVWQRDCLDRPVNSDYDIEVIEGTTVDQIWSRNYSTGQTSQSSQGFGGGGGP